MAKKTRRPRGNQPSGTTFTAASGDKKQLSSAEQFALEYAYVIKDLRHILILAGIMFALLILANLILQ